MQSRVMLLLIIIAVVLAIVGFLLVSILTRGPALPGGGTGQPGDGGIPVGEPLSIDNTTVFLQPQPDKTVRLQEEAPTAAPPPAQPLPTETPQPQPEQPLPTNTPEPTLPPPTAIPQPAAPAASGQGVIFIDYQVQPGDTLYSISKAQGTSIELMAVHGIDAADLEPGRVLRLPVANPQHCPNMRTYVVRPGDNVFRIARQFNTTKEAIAAANNLNTATWRINIAQVLCIP